MNSKYVIGNRLSISDLRHDLSSLLVPLETTIEPIGGSRDPKVSELQTEILLHLKSIIHELQELPDSAALKAKCEV